MAERALWLTSSPRVRWCQRRGWLLRPRVEETLGIECTLDGLVRAHRRLGPLAEQLYTLELAQTVFATDTPAQRTGQGAQLVGGRFDRVDIDRIRGVVEERRMEVAVADVAPGGARQAVYQPDLTGE